MTRTFRSLSAAGQHLDRNFSNLASNAKKAQLAGERKVAAAVEAAVAANLGGNPIHLRGVGRTGADVGVRTTIAGPLTIVRLTGPGWLREFTVNPHWVGQKKEDQTGEAPHMRVSGQWKTGPFFGSRSEGQHPFKRGVEEVRPLAARILGSEINLQMRRSFGL